MDYPPDSMHWHDVVLAYMSYLAVVSVTSRRFARARIPVLVAAAVAWGGFALAGHITLSPALAVTIPSLILLAGYWLSGLFFVRPDPRVEGWLWSVDKTVLARVLGWYRSAPRLVTEYFELSYFLVYAAVPGGAVTVIVGGHADQIDRFWTFVLMAEFACYGMLPWIQSRPPRDLEPKDAGNGAVMRKLNRAIGDRASIHVNTVPSGHAAGALATALAVGSVMPEAGAVFQWLAWSIVAATVLGRYHYLVDSALGVLVAIGACIITR